MKRDKGILFLCERKLIFITKAVNSLGFALGRLKVIYIINQSTPVKSGVKCLSIIDLR